MALPKPPRAFFALEALLIFTIFSALGHASRFSWMTYDRFDEVNDHVSSITGQNCKSRSKEELVLRPDTVSQLPVYNRLFSQIWYKNRTKLIHLHNMALNRAFFYSYVLQRMNDSSSFHQQPNWLYMYMSATADINANPDGINSSAIFFDTHCHYPNWYQTIPFNKTLPLFGPRAWRHDDFQDQDNLLREPTRQVAMVSDLGAGRTRNYTHPTFKMNTWYSKWMPDLKADMDSLTKFTYYVGVKYSNATGRFSKKEFEAVSFFGPSSPSASDTDPRLLPVVFTQPYFDCGRSNKWVVSTVSPVIDFMPRYSNWTHMRRQRVVAAVVMDIDFRQVDFNACAVGKGNPGPSYLSGIHRCRKTTSCKHRSGWGFQRGGYKCSCRAGLHFPWQELKASWDGDIIEQATKSEYDNGFTCLPTDFRQVLPHIDLLDSVTLEGGSNSLSSGGLDLGIGNVSLQLSNQPERRTRRSINSTGYQQHFPVVPEEHGIKKPPVAVPHGMFADVKASHDQKVIKRANLEKAHASKRLQRKSALDTDVNDIKTKMRPVVTTRTVRQKRASVFDEKAFNRMMRIFRHKESVKGDNCHLLAPHNLVMAGDVAYGVDKQFELEARTALRLSHFLCNYLQNTNPLENFGNLRGGGRLHTEHMFAEVIANVMGNFKIYSSGVFFDRYKFENQDGSKRELFGPWAFRKQGRVDAMDTAGRSTRYTDEDWFQTMKRRWATNMKDLKEYKMRSYIRSDPQGTSSIKHEHFPLVYKAPNYNSGFWTRPYFRCDGHVDAWVISYVTPFFGLIGPTRLLEFRGVVTVDIPLNMLQLNPCPMEFYVPNAFKNTARCDYSSSTCKPIYGHPFTRGAYSCRCRRGFEYMHKDGKNWMHGGHIEMEYERKIRGLFNRLHTLRCRVAGSSPTSSSPVVIIASMIMVIVTTTFGYHSP